jgi:hypothetical protein
MYVRITFLIAFIFFSLGYISLKIQARNTPLIFDTYKQERIRLNFIPLEEVDNDPIQLAFEMPYEVSKVQQHPFHVLPSSF